MSKKEKEEKQHIVPYRTFLLVLLALLAFTFTSIGVTSYNLGPLTVVVALVLATFKTTLILTYFMHLKFDVRLFGILVTAVLALIGVVIFITFLDYLYR
jgi:cytochrome c oxidase subunit 4